MDQVQKDQIIKEIENAIYDGNLGRVRELRKSLLVRLKEPWRTSYKFLCVSLLYNQREISTFLLDRTPVNCKLTYPHSTPIHLALEHNDLELIEILLRKGADINVENNFGKTAFQLAYEMKNFPAIELFLKYGVNVEQCVCHENVKHGGQLLLHLVRNGHQNAVKLILEKGANVHAKDQLCKTALDIAVEHGHLKIVEFLLDHGACVDSLQFIHSPLHLAIEKQHIAIVQLLLRRNNNNININTKGPTNKAPLHLVVQRKSWNTTMFKTLLYHGANVNVKDDENKTPLHIAIESQCWDAVSLLVKHGADVNVIDNQGQMPLHIAVQNGYVAIPNLIRHGANVNARNKYAKTPLHIAVEQKNMSALNYLLEHGAQVDARTQLGKDPLYIAVEMHNLSIVEQLLKFKANVNSSDQFGRTVLHLAVKIQNVAILECLLVNKADINAKIISGIWKGYTPLHLAVESNNEAVINKLLDYNPDLDVKDKNGNTALHVAMKITNSKLIELMKKASAENKAHRRSLITTLVTCDNENTVDLLTQNNITINAGDLDYELLTAVVNKESKSQRRDLLNHLLRSPIPEIKEKIMCIAAENNSCRIVDLALAYGANINYQEDSKKSIIYTAVERSNMRIVRHILCRLSKKSICDPELLHTALRKSSKAIIELFLQFDADVNATNKEGITLFQHAIVSSQTPIAKLLAERGANINVPFPDDGKSCLHIAATKNIRLVRLLLEYNVDVNAVDNLGNTVLHTVASIKTRDPTAVEILKTNRANVNINNKEGDTPLHIAARTGNYKMVRVLIDHGAHTECKNHQGYNALHVAVGVTSTPKTLNHLLEWSHNIETKAHGQTALDMLLSTKNISNGSWVFAIQEHVIKRKSANLFLSEEFLSLVEKHFPDTYRPRSTCRIDWSALELLKTECKTELERMKGFKIEGTNLYLYDLFKKNTDQIAALLRNESIARSLDKIMFRSLADKIRIQFPKYANMIEGLVRYGRRRKKLLDDVTKHSHELFPLLPFYCAQQIFTYLENEDLVLLLDLF
ncbi:hypothetical protein M8J77_009566 [Diaphorina citri]|nr:hypothetical protein M8J77_009566 [Diaphorina citri]